MKRILLAIALCFFATFAHAENTIGPTNQVLCNKIATLTGAAVITQIVAPVTGQTIYVCGWTVTNTGATGSFSLQTGTGTTCGTNTVTAIPALSITSTAPATDHDMVAAWQTPLSSALCITPSVATITSIIYYAQF